MTKGIDVSKHQGIIDWEKVKNAGIEFAIIRCGFGDDIESQDDSTFEDNYNQCKKIGLKVGTYLYSYADSIEHAKSEAKHVLRLINGKSFEYGVWYDLEDENTIGKCTNDEIAKISETFCSEIKKYKYEVGIYANKNWFNTRLTSNIFTQYKKWCASYGKDDGDIPDDKYKYSGNHSIWQYTSAGTVDGISGNVDMDICYDDISLETNELPEKIDIIYQVYTNGRWQPNVKNTEDYAGVYGMEISGVLANLSKGDITYKVHLKDGKWLPEVVNRSDYAGILGKTIDGLMMKSDICIIKYRVHIKNGKWLPWVSNYDEKDSENGYAGILGKNIDAIQIEVV